MGKNGVYCTQAMKYRAHRGVADGAFSRGCAVTSNRSRVTERKCSQLRICGASELLYLISGFMLTSETRRKRNSSYCSSVRELIIFAIRRLRASRSDAVMICTAFLCLVLGYR